MPSIISLKCAISASMSRFVRALAYPSSVPLSAKIKMSSAPSNQ